MLDYNARKPPNCVKLLNRFCLVEQNKSPLAKEGLQGF